MWRPFASDFVSHTYDDFRKKMDRIWALKPISKQEPENKRPNSHFPYQFGQEELARRLNEFSELQVKVSVQRKSIRERDLLLESSLKKRIHLQNKANELVKRERRMSMVKVREMAENKIHRHRSTKSQDNDFNYSSALSKTGYFTQKETLNQMSTLKLE